MDKFPPAVEGRLWDEWDAVVQAVKGWTRAASRSLPNPDDIAAAEVEEEARSEALRLMMRFVDDYRAFDAMTDAVDAPGWLDSLALDDADDGEVLG